MLLTTSEDDNATLAKSIHNKPKNEVANKLPNGYVVCDWYTSLKQNSPENPSFFQISSLKFLVFGVFFSLRQILNEHCPLLKL